MASSLSSRSARIDLLRGLAIFVVLLLHFSLTYSLIDSALSLIIPARWIGAVVDNGNYGVTLFFVISGFLITSNNLQRYERLSEVRLRHFYTLRFARIVPPLLLALMIVVPLGCLRIASFANISNNHPMPASFFVLAVISVLTFWHNVLMEARGYFNYCLNIYWSAIGRGAVLFGFPSGLRAAEAKSIHCRAVSRGDRGGSGLPRNASRG